MAKLLTTPFLPAHSFNNGVLTFISSSKDLLQHPSTLRDYYTSEGTDPLHPALLFCTVMSLVVWILGEVTGNVSQVDRLWTFLPIIYSAHFTFWPYFTGAAKSVLSERMLLVFVLQLIWSARLTTNTYRRGFFNPKEEDYRWPYVRNRIPTWAFKIMNFVFIAFMQNMLLLAAELPQYLLLTIHLAKGRKQPKLGATDWVLSVVFVSILAVEMLADNQQQRYQKLKREALQKSELARTEKENAAIKRGFVTGGLWSFSRHPNFACEQSTWWVMYLFTVLPFLPPSTYDNLFSNFTYYKSILAHVPFDRSSLYSYLLPGPRDTLKSHVIGSAKDVLKHGLLGYARLRSFEGVYWNYSIWSPVLMSLLFYSSTDLTERISSEKYPLYKQYQQRVAMFWPPITTLKGVWLFVTARLGKVEKQVYGIGEASDGKLKKL